MHSSGLNRIRVVALVLLMAGVVLLLFSSGAGASGQTTLDVEGVYCVDLWFHGDTPPTKGQAHEGNLRVAKIMMRVESAKSGQTEGWDIMIIGYNAAGSPIPDIPPSEGTCKEKTDGNTLVEGIPPANILGQTINDRPTVQDVSLLAKTEGKALRWVTCTDFAAGLDQVWVRTEWNLLLDPSTQTFGDQTNYLDVTPPTELVPPGTDCGTETEPLYTVLEITPRLATKGPPVAGPDDWDGDGRSDWEELAPLNELLANPPVKCDPFVPTDDHCTPPVGGLSVDVTADEPVSPLETAQSSGTNAGLLAGVIAAISAVAITVTGAAWYARRRLIS